MKYHILVTGGVGFIGSHLVDALINEGHEVTILDNLEPQVHPNVPRYLNKNAKFVRGDVKDYNLLKSMVKDVDIIFHEAAMVGVGQSMYEVKKYIETNVNGTANLLDLLVNTEHNVKKLLVASSMSIYGEGSYKCENCGYIEPGLRTLEQMRDRDFELHCPKCGNYLEPIATPEDKKLASNSIYAISKKVQEELCLTIGKAYSIPVVALRYFNVYGPRQSLSNPYTGVVAIFMSRIKNNKPPIIFEDGNQSRDFISVYDIVRANIIAMRSSNANYEVFNVGTSKPITIKRVAEILIELYGINIKPLITNNFRKGDVRHCFADISKIKSKLGFEPKVGFEQGLKELIEWSKHEEAVDKVEDATKELKNKGLLI